MNKIKKYIRLIRAYLNANLATKSDIENLYNQLFGVINICNAMNGGHILKPMRGWAISPDVMIWIISELKTIKNPIVIEFGSGQSTVILASILKNQGGTLISVEHDVDYFKNIQKQIDAAGLTQVVKPIHAPLTNYETFNSYEINRISGIGVPDLALVDGPPSFDGTMARYTPLIWCVENMKSGGVIYLDDSLRQGEKLCIKQLKQDYANNIEIKELFTEKGLAEIRVK